MVPWGGAAAPGGYNGGHLEGGVAGSPGIGPARDPALHGNGRLRARPCRAGARPVQAVSATAGRECGKGSVGGCSDRRRGAKPVGRGGVAMVTLGIWRGPWGDREQLGHFLRRGHPVQRLAGASVELACDAVELDLAASGQIAALG